MSRLSDNEFLNVIQHTQLLSFDLLVQRSDGRYLLGLRKNNPARGYFFVPGGRVRKGETLRDGLQRVLSDELGLSVNDCECTIWGLYDHVYTNDNFFAADGVDTHYVAIAMHVKLAKGIAMNEKFYDQHAMFMWNMPEELAENNRVHINTKYFFMDDAPNKL